MLAQRGQNQALCHPDKVSQHSVAQHASVCCKRVVKHFVMAWKHSSMPGIVGILAYWVYQHASAFMHTLALQRIPDGVHESQIIWAVQEWGKGGEGTKWRRGVDRKGWAE